MMARHILPQCIAPYLILATTHLGVAIIIEASARLSSRRHSRRRTPTWGNMLADSLKRVSSRPGGWCCSRAARLP